MSIKYNYTFVEKLLFPSKRINKDRLKEVLSGKTVLITGASFGIGEKTAEKLAFESVTLVLVARTYEKLEQIRERLEKKAAQVFIFSLDLYKYDEVESLIRFLEKNNLAPDIFISNAGKSIKRSIWKSLDRFHDFSRTMNINYFAPVNILLHLIPVLYRKKGQIINVSTMNALLPPINYWAAYSASKIAFDIWLKSVKPELGKITFSSLYLPLVRTRMISPTKSYDKMPAMKPEHVGDLICDIIIRKKRKYSVWWTVFARITAFLFAKKWRTYSK